MANGEGSNATAESAQTQLLRQAAEALKSLALKAMRAGTVLQVPAGAREDVLLADMAYCSEPTLKLVPGDAVGSGLLDSGASVCLRQAVEGELLECTSRTVSLAVGKRETMVNSAVPSLPRSLQTLSCLCLSSLRWGTRSAGRRKDYS